MDTPEVPRRVDLALEAPELVRGRLGLRRSRASQAPGAVRLIGSEIVFAHPTALVAGLTVPAGLVAVASVDAGEGGGGDVARFPITAPASRPSRGSKPPPAEAWLWTARDQAAMPCLGDGAPNLAIVFTGPLDPERVAATLAADVLEALAERSPHREPTVLGLLARVTDPGAARKAFKQLGVLGALTQREVPPARQRRVSFGVAEIAPRPKVVSASRASVGPPGL